jgi:predicted transcriptional regulator YheO
MIKVIKNSLALAESIAQLLQPYAEVVIHDIKKNKIAAIFNSFSKRRVGDDSLLTTEDIPTLNDSLGPYEKTNWDGKKLKSVSSLLRDEKGVVVAMLCINLDVSQLSQINTLLTAFINPDQLVAQPVALFKDDWQDRINNYVYQYLREKHLNLASLTRIEKQKLLEHLNAIGAFKAKNAAQYVANVLRVSRATIYNYLNQQE